MQIKIIYLMYVHLWLYNKVMRMKKIVLLLLLLSGCSKSEIISQIELETKTTDSTYKYRPHRPKDTTDKRPIRFDVHITDWENYDTN